MCRLILLSTLLLGLTACEERISVRHVCQNEGQFCEDLNTDGRCNHERAEVIVSRYLEKQTPSDETRYNLLLDFEEYSKCIGLYSKIEHKKRKEKTTDRVNAYLTSLKELKRLNDLTRTSSYPPLLYFHWSRHGDDRALKKLLRQEQHESMQNAEMQYFLATYYLKFDREKTKDLLYKALEYNEKGHEPNPDIFTTLINIYYKEKKLKQAYVWALIAREFEVENVQIEPIEYALQKQGKSIAKLEDLADKTLDQIMDGEFFSPRG